MTTSVSHNNRSREEITSLLKEAVRTDQQVTINEILNAWPVQPSDVLPATLTRATSSLTVQVWPFYVTLYEAIEQQKTVIVSYLLDRGVAIDEDAISSAIHAGSSDNFKAFLDHGWNIDTPVGVSKPPALAYICTDEILLSWFLAHGADPNATPPRIPHTPIMFAVSSAPLSAIKTLFAHGAKSLNTLQTVAKSRQEGRVEVMKYLLDQGAEINARKWEDHPETWKNFEMLGLGTALHYAARNGDSKTVSFLLGRGARVDIDDSIGETPLENARWCCENNLKDGDDTKKQEHQQCIALLVGAKSKLRTINARM